MAKKKPEKTVTDVDKTVTPDLVDVEPGSDADETPVPEKSKTQPVR